MSEANDDPNAPRNLGKVFGMMGGFREHVRRGKRRRIITTNGDSAHEKLPRQVCPLCLNLRDYALIPKGSIPQVSQCSDCTKTLASGYYAAYSSEGCFFIKAEGELADLAGKIVRFSPENWKQIKERYESSKKPPENSVDSN